MGRCTIEESGMVFGKYNEENVFEIEKSNQYCEKLRQRKVKSCEFILLRKDKLFFIEAKTTCPRFDENDDSTKEYVQEILEKMRDSLMLYTAIILNVHSQAGIPRLLIQTDLSNRPIVLLLVVKNAEKEWLINFKEVLSKKLVKERAIYGIKDVLVINEEQARKKNLII